jgi:hypothetical protein
MQPVLRSNETVSDSAFVSRTEAASSIMVDVAVVVVAVSVTGAACVCLIGVAMAPRPAPDRRRLNSNCRTISADKVTEYWCFGP